VTIRAPRCTPKFSLATVPIVGVYDTITGIPGTFTTGLNLLNNATTPFSFYYLEPAGPAFTIMEDNNTHQSCAVAHDAGNFKTIAALFEYGTLSDISPQATRELMTAYLTFFGVHFDPVGVDVVDAGLREIKFTLTRQAGR
jgi:hypothetical protein